MHCAEDECVCSVKKENNLGYYRLHTIWRKDGFFINVTSRNGAWRGEMTPGDVAKISAQLELEPESYLSQCREALTRHGGQPGIVYAVEDGRFSWKKMEDEDSGIKIKLGSVMLEPASFEDTIQNLVTAALNCNRNLQEKLKEVTEENRKIAENKNELLQKLNELIKIKEEMEADLYKKFILLNTAKKKKIQELENLVEEYKKNGFSVTNSDNPYEIETDRDSEEEKEEEEDAFFSGANKGEIKITENTEKDSDLKKSLLDEPDVKKVKSNDEKSHLKDTSCLSPTLSQPSTSKNIPGSKEKTTSGTRLTKDELYDFFYGEL